MPRFLLPLVFALPLAASLLPLPLRMTPGSGEMPITAGFRVTLQGASDPRLQPAADRFVAQVSKQTGIPILPSSGNAPLLTVDCAAAGLPVQSLSEDESYRLEITPTGARLTAPNPLGVMHGFATFLQLVTPNFTVPSMTIDDGPRFPWRGLHMDVSRHWMPVEVIQRNLDGMAAVKLNVFHWHLSDNQGFRVESKLYPKLHQLGSDGLYYTQDQIRETVAYARARGIRVVPEFDVPGHSTSWLVGYPELAAAPGPFQIGRTWGIFEPVMDPTKDALYVFLDRFFGEMSALFPDAYFHIGGDEVDAREWNANAAIGAFKRSHNFSNNDQLQAYFNRRLLPLVTAHGKKMMGWDEILAPDLPKDIVIHSWRGQKSLADAARQGFQAILSSGYYLDHMDTAAAHYLVDPLIDPKTGQALALTDDQRTRILGGEVCMWSEYVSSENVDSRIWPRTAAVAERFWSPQEARDIPSLYARLATVSAQLEWYGLTHRTSLPEMLDRLSGGQAVAPLRLLADSVTPLGLGGRARARKYVQQTPLNRLVDAARPESAEAADLTGLIAAKKWDAVELRLRAWKLNDSLLIPLLKSNPALTEALPLSTDLSAAGSLALEALGFIRGGTKPPAAWMTRANAFLTDAKKPRAEVILAIAAPLRTLIDRANEQRR